MSRLHFHCLMLLSDGFWSSVQHTTARVNDSTWLQRPLILIISTEQYLQSPLQLEHACNMLLDSELFAFHSERMCEIIVHDAKTVRLPQPFNFILIELIVSTRQLTRIPFTYSMRYSSSMDVVDQTASGHINAGNHCCLSWWITLGLRLSLIPRTPMPERLLLEAPNSLRFPSL